MSKFILMLLLATVSSNAMALGAYQVYECKSENDMNSCSNSCKKNTTTVDFKVNPSSSTVLATFYYGEGHKSGALEHCKVVDADNWVCGSVAIVNNAEYLNITDKQRLSGGIYASSITVLFRHGNRSDTYFCAKKRSLFGIFN
jgi:hypothetical protein